MGAIFSKGEHMMLLIGDIAILTISLWLSLALRHFSPPQSEVFYAHIIPFSLLFLIWVSVFFLSGLYGKYTTILRKKLPSIIFIIQTLNVILAGLFFLLFPQFNIAPKTTLVIYLLVSSGLLYLWRIYFYPRAARRRPFNALLIGSGREMTELVEEINHNDLYPIQIVAIIYPNEKSKHELEHAIVQTIAEKNITMIIADLNNPRISAITSLIYNISLVNRLCEFVNAGRLYEEMFARVPISLAQHEWLLANMLSYRGVGYRTTKRAVDVFGAIVGGVCALALLPFVYIAIKLEDGGPIFISQGRIGLHGNIIHIYKIRSMTGNDNGVYQDGQSQLVVTKVGKIIRRLRIDELPQLWNILRGDLSFVGPRPELPALAKEYEASIPYYQLRYMVTPGVSGWAQIKHDRDPHHGTDMRETSIKLSYDLYYIKARSLLLDMYILFQTVKTVLTYAGK